MLPIKTELIQPIGEHNPPQECVLTECTGHLLKCNFTHFNPMQSMFIPYVDEEDKNVVIAAPTCGGKTTCAELACAQAVFGSNRTKKAMYLAPLKALADEKLRDWREPTHTFSQLKVAALTGDYQMDDNKRVELENADIILCTSEMLDSKSRRYDNNTWLHNIGVVVVDESHLIGTKERGPRLETAIMRFHHYNPSCRWVLMSATCPNVKDFAKWLNKLTQRKTLVLENGYRPCILNKHFIQFDDTASKSKRYAEIEALRMQATLEVISKNSKDQHLIFTGNKNWGKRFLHILNNYGFSCDFHNADLGPEKRRQIETDFNSGKIQVLVASSTLAWGVNVNARRVVLAHTSYGLDPMEVADVEQACGRAGRIKYHTEGDAYILLPYSKFDTEMARISAGFDVKSQLNDINVLIFHVVNEINNGNISSKKELFEWYEQSLASVQKDMLTEEGAQKVLDFLVEKNMIKLNEDGKYATTQLGNVASTMYQHPLDVYDWYQNFSHLGRIAIAPDPDGKNKRQVQSADLNTCLALADIYHNNKKDSFISSAEKDCEAVIEFCSKTGKQPNAMTKVAAVYYALLRGKEVDDPLRSLHFALLNDLPRVTATLKMMHVRYGAPVTKILGADKVSGWRYDPGEWDVLYVRLKNGIGRHLVLLASLPEIGKVSAQKLYDNGLRTKKDVMNQRHVVEATIGVKRAEKMYNRMLEKK